MKLPVEVLYSEAIEALRLRIDDQHIAIDVPMKNHTSFKIGGPADMLITPSSIDDIQHAYSVLRARGIPITLMGNGSNILVSDLGIRGAVVKISETFKGIERQGNFLIAQGGALLSTLANRAYSEGLGGFEWASGIPGTVGGAVFMNAGAYGGEMKDVVHAITVLNRDGHILRLTRDLLTFDYRSSSVQERDLVVISVELELTPRNQEDIKVLMDDFNEKRTTKQPLSMPSAGSTFKRPEGYFAGKLIEDSGLRGFRYGDAMISTLHCGFVVNAGEATCAQVTTLIQTVQKIVLDLQGVELQPEIRMIGAKE